MGLALQPLLKNIFAGIQLATAQPIRNDDALLIENEAGQVEEITATHVVVRLRDWRRLIVPHTARSDTTSRSPCIIPMAQPARLFTTRVRVARASPATR